MAQSSSKDGNKRGPDPRKPIPPPMQSIVKGGWTYRIENPTETAATALRQLADQIRRHSWAFVRHGPRMLSPAETAERELNIAELAGEIDMLAKQVPDRDVVYADLEAVLARLRQLGFFPDNLLISNVARALHALERARGETGIGTQSR